MQWGGGWDGVSCAAQWLLRPFPPECLSHFEAAGWGNLPSLSPKLSLRYPICRYQPENIMDHLNVLWTSGKPCDELALCSTPYFGASCFLVCCLCREHAGHGKVWRGRCLPSTSALLCVSMSNLKHGQSCVRIHSSGSVWEVWTLSVNILLTAVAQHWLQGKGAFCFCVTVPNPSLSLGWRGGERRKQQVQAGSCWEHLNADMSEAGKCVTGSFPVTWILRA